MVHFFEIPAVNRDYYSLMSNARQSLVEMRIALDNGNNNGERAKKNPSERYSSFSLSELERAVHQTVPKKTVLALRALHKEQAPMLEQMLLEYAANYGIPAWFGGNDVLLQYSVIIEGRCLHHYKKGDDKKGLRSHKLDVGGPIKLSELQKNWHEIILLDDRFEKEEGLRALYTPRCEDHRKHGETLLVSTVHVFTALKNQREVSLPYYRFDARTKSGSETAFKHLQWLIGETHARGGPMVVEDYLASRSVSSEGFPFASGFVRFLEGYRSGFATSKHINWSGLIFTQNCETVIDDLEQSLNGQKHAQTVYRKRIKPQMLIERVAGSKNNEVRFIEAKIPIGFDGEIYNQINHHFETDDWYNEREGTGYNHLSYAAIRLNRRLEEWSALHWIVLRDVALPIFEDHSRDFLYDLANRRIKSLVKP